MTGSGSHSKRRTILVDKRSQLSLTLLMVLYMVAYTILMLAVILAPSIIRFTSPDLDPQERLEASREFMLLDQRVVPVVLVIMVALALHVIFITHRIFGPLARFRRILGEWRGGRWPQGFYARQRDFHRELFSTFNDTAAHLRVDVGFARDRLGEALEALETPGDTGAAAARDRCRQALERLGNYTI